jgi:hypothetical protein
VLKRNRLDIVRRKTSKAVVVSAISWDEIPALTTSLQISLSACKDGSEAYEVRGGGALREVGSFNWLDTDMNPT